MVLYKKAIFFILLLIGGKLLGQQELMLHQLPNVWHKNTLNPAWFPDDKRIAIGLPALSLDQMHSGNISLSDFIKKENGKSIIDISQAISKLEDNNHFLMDERIETVSFGIKLGKWGLQVGHAIRFNGDIKYPKSLAQLVWEGNGPYIGQTLNIAPSVNFTGWNELGLGVSRKFLNVTVGARVKYLSGIGAIVSDEDHQKASVYTDTDIYQLTLNTDYAFHSGNVVNAFDTSGYIYNIKTNKLDAKQLFSKNSGLAFDLGATFKLTDKIQVQASVLDLNSKIKWKDEANYFKSKGSFQYDGATIPGADIINASDSLNIGNQLDSLNDIFQFVKTPESFSTVAPMRFYLGGTLQITKKIAVGAVFTHLQGEARQSTSGGINAQYSPFKYLSLGAMYSINDQSESRLGVNLVVKPGPVQLYFASDNILSGVSGYKSPAVNFRVGAAVVL